MIVDASSENRKNIAYFQLPGHSVGGKGGLVTIKEMISKHDNWDIELDSDGYVKRLYCNGNPITDASNAEISYGPYTKECTITIKTFNFRYINSEGNSVPGKDK